MPQVDLETLVCGRDSKVSCETLTDLNPNPDPSFPPESITIAIESFDQLPLYERDDSTKESTNPKSQSHHNPIPTPTRSNSSRYSSSSSKPNGPILGLPHKIKHVTTITCSSRNNNTNSRIFPKKKRAGATVPEQEPTSPKVSCFGKVLSDREREQCCQLDQRLQRRRSSPGCWAGMAAMLVCGGRVRDDVAAAAAGEDEVDLRRNIRQKRRNIPSSLEEEVEPAAAVPGLGGMKRFASGRRAASWGGDEDGDRQVAVDLGRRSLDNGAH